MPRLALAALVGLAAFVPPAQAARPDTTDVPGLLVMAHGGGDDWNETVEAAVAPLQTRVPVAVAFGMADPASLAAGLDDLRQRGVTRVAVVRLFLDGRSFLHQTEFFLGLRPDPPARFVLHGHGAHHGHGPASSPEPLAHGLRVALSPDGLMQADEVADILATRAAALSTAPAHESVLVLAHGTGDDVDNARWVAAIEHASGGIRALGVHAVRVETLREDWPESRAAAERAIRAFAAAEAEAGRTVLVVPFRLAGFGPYSEVLGDLPHRTDATGLLPHPAVTDWIEHEYVRILEREGWETTS